MVIATAMVTTNYGYGYDRAYHHHRGQYGYATRSHASKSCMTSAEARAQFATSDLYWHGPSHCWDATAPQYRIRVKPREQRAQDNSAPEVTAKHDGAVPAKHEPKWRNAMSEMLPVDASGVASAVPSLPAIEATAVNWLDRWVEVAQLDPTSFLRNTEVASAEVPPTASQKADPMVTPMRLVLVFFSIVMILAAIELLFRNTMHKRLD